MKRLVVKEHTRVERVTRKTVPSDDETNVRLDSRLYERLRAFDRKNGEDGSAVFDWADGYFRTTQWVGVVNVAGLQVEILPKVDVPFEGTGSLDEHEDYQTRRNLLFMLAVGGNVPVRNRDMARLAVRKAPLSETLIAIFAGRLKEELLRGPERNYVEQEANLRCFKGKLHVGKHVLLNAAHRERFCCRYDEFLDDTLMNRIFKASCHVLLAVTRTPATQDVLRQCVLLLDSVTDTEIQDADFSLIGLNRQNERFEDLLNFCRLLLSGRSPTAQAGENKTFSLLFDMNKVFERFVAAFVKRFVCPRIHGVKVFPQAMRHKRYLLDCNQHGVLRLEPDLLVEGPDHRLIMDTKWKLLKEGKKGRGGVADGDLYQLHAYTRRYACKRSVLLYPFTKGLEPRDFDVIDGNGDFSGERICVRQVDLHRNLHTENGRTALAEELESILREGLMMASETSADNLAVGSVA